MNKTTVWFNAHPTSMPELIRSADPGDPFKLVFSYKRIEPTTAQVFEVEPAELADDAYLDYMLDFVRRHGVQVFVPSRETGLDLIAANKDRFEQAGARVVLTGNLETLQCIDDKGACYVRLKNLDTIPDYHVVHNLASFESTCLALLQKHPYICFKPVSGVNAIGFRVMSETGSQLPGRSENRRAPVSLSQATEYLAAQDFFERGVMVMQYLEGKERSVDCLAHAGQLVTGVIRSKQPVCNGVGKRSDNIQMLEDRPDLIERVARITRELTLNGLFNVQFKDSGGVSYLLEINARMAGGISIACQSGVVLPYWAIRLAMGTASPDDVPRPKTGVLVQKLEGRTFTL